MCGATSVCPRQEVCMSLQTHSLDIAFPGERTESVLESKLFDRILIFYSIRCKTNSSNN